MNKWVLAACGAALAMGAVGHEVPVLPVAQHLQGPGRIGRAPGQDDAEQQVGLGQRQREQKGQDERATPSHPRPRG